MPMWIKGAHASPSPSGNLLASVTDDCLRICFTSSPERCIDFATRIAVKDIVALRWAQDSSRVIIVTSALIEIIDLEDEQSRIRLNNGTSGLGKFITVDFLQPDLVLSIWEFGRAKIWNLSNGQGIDIDNIKTFAQGQRWAIRPAAGSSQSTMAYLSRPAADDLLIIQFQGAAAALPPIKLVTVDAGSIHWSPDGHWLAVLDSPRQPSNVQILTSDGHLYKSYPTIDESQNDCLGLGIKSVVWSPTSQTLALLRHDGCIDLISGRTLSQTAMIEHSTIDNQDDTVPQDQAAVWQECVSASQVRSYKPLTVPVSPPLSRTKVTYEPRELGVAEAIFSCDGTYLASRDESMLSTVWIWDVANLCPQSVIIQHSNVKKMCWHATISDLLMIDCGENIIYMVNVQVKDSPKHFVIAAVGNASFTLLPEAGAERSSATILATTKTGFSVFLTGADSDQGKDRTSGVALRDAFGQDDSIFEILSGRLNGTNAADLSYTERIEMDAASQQDTVQMDDTFDGRHKKLSNARDAFDDDSEIF